MRGEWNPELIVALRICAGDVNMSYPEFAALHGRTWDAVSSKARSLGLRKTMAHRRRFVVYPLPSAPGWSEDQIKQFNELWPSGLSTREIGLRIGKTKNAVIGMLWRKGVIGRARESSADRVSRIAKIFPESGCLYARGEPATGGWDFCGHSQHVVFDKYGEPIRSAYCVEHHALTHRKALKSENAAVLALKRDSTTRVRWTRA